MSLCIGHVLLVASVCVITVVTVGAAAVPASAALAPARALHTSKLRARTRVAAANPFPNLSLSPSPAPSDAEAMAMDALTPAPAPVTGAATVAAVSVLERNSATANNANAKAKVHSNSESDESRNRIHNRHRHSDRAEEQAATDVNVAIGEGEGEGASVGADADADADADAGADAGAGVGNGAQLRVAIGKKMLSGFDWSDGNLITLRHLWAEGMASINTIPAHIHYQIADDGSGTVQHATWKPQVSTWERPSFLNNVQIAFERYASSGFDKGHIVAASLGGDNWFVNNNPLNFFPQHSVSNGGASVWNHHEDVVEQLFALDHNTCQVEVHQTFKYPPNSNQNLQNFNTFQNFNPINFPSFLENNLNINSKLNLDHLTPTGGEFHIRIPTSCWHTLRDKLTQSIDVSGTINNLAIVVHRTLGWLKNEVETYVESAAGRKAIITYFTIEAATNAHRADSPIEEDEQSAQNRFAAINSVDEKVKIVCSHRQAFNFHTDGFEWKRTWTNNGKLDDMQQAEIHRDNFKQFMIPFETHQNTYRQRIAWRDAQIHTRELEEAMQLHQMSPDNDNYNVQLQQALQKFTATEAALPGFYWCLL